MEHPYRHRRRQSHIVDYLGNVISYTPSGYNTFVTGIVDIEALRQFRVMNLNSNWMKDLRTEVFRRMYEEPIHPKNLWLEQDPKRHARGRRGLPREHQAADRARHVHAAGPRLPGREVLPDGRSALAGRGLGEGAPPLGPSRTSRMTDRYDVVIVGGGHNGLTCAAYLAKAGKKVLVLEARDVVGRRLRDEGGRRARGSATTSIRTSTGSSTWARCSATSSSSDTEPTYVWPENQFGHVFPDGRALVWSRDLETTVERSRASRSATRNAPRAGADVPRVLEEGMSPRCSPRRGRPRGSPPSKRSAAGFELARHFLTTPNHLARALSSRRRCRRGSGSGSRSSPEPATSSGSVRTTR